MREGTTARCVREGIIPGPHSNFFKEQICSEDRSLPSIHTNNPLAAEPETENDATRSNCSVSSFKISLRLKRRLQRQQRIS
jgi:hypothetical protein